MRITRYIRKNIELTRLVNPKGEKKQTNGPHDVQSYPRNDTSSFKRYLLEEYRNIQSITLEPLRKISPYLGLERITIEKASLLPRPRFGMRYQKI